MQDRFKAGPSAIRVRKESLERTVSEIFARLGVPDGDNALAADALVTADLRGAESHGVSVAVGYYVRALKSGEIKARPDWRIVRETPATASIDSDAGLGLIVAPKAMEIAIEKARNVGVGVVTMHNGRHLGMASYHAMIALESDMIGVCMTSAPPTIVPTFGAETRLGTNPIAVAAPADKEAPFVFDVAMSVIAANKLIISQRLGINLLPGWVAAEDGTPIMEESPPPPPKPGGFPESRLLPLGSTPEMGSHKGYGFAAMVDILSGILTGGGYGYLPPVSNYGHHVAAYSVEAFMDTGEFKRTMDEFLQMLMSTRPAAGHDRVVYPGLLEAETEVDRRANGVPLHLEVFEGLREVCAELSVPFDLVEA